MPLPRTISEEYLSWNRRLLDYCLTCTDGGDGRVFLTVEPFLEAQPERDAEDLFIAAVRKAVYDTYRTQGESLLPVFRGYDSKYPLCAALLGITVLAASEMNDRSYYDHLARLLNFSIETTKKLFAPDGSHQKTEIEQSWEQIQTFFRRNGLNLPDPPNKGHRHVKIPQQHALLRKLDIRRLADFFYTYKFLPQYHYPENLLRFHFSSWMRSQPLTNCGMGAWADLSRQDAVLRQVTEALASWDAAGYRSWRNTLEYDRRYSSFPNTEPQKTHQLEGDRRHFDRIRRVPVTLYLELGEEGVPAALSFRLTQQDGLPDSIPFAGGQFVRRGGTYSLLRIDNEMAERALIHSLESDPFQGTNRTNSERTILCFKANDPNTYTYHSAFTFSQDEWGWGYSQTESLQLGMPGAILVQRNLVHVVQSWAQTKAQSSPVKKVSLGKRLDQKWSLLTCVEPRRAAAAPADLSCLHISTGLILRLKGGLRLDPSQSIWMVGAPPRPVFQGDPLPTHGFIDENEVSLNKGQFPESFVSSLLNSEGEYRLSGIAESSLPVRRWIRIQEPKLLYREDSGDLSALFGDYRTSLTPVSTTLDSPASSTSSVADADKASIKQWWLFGESPGMVQRIDTGELPTKAHAEGTDLLWALGFGQGGVSILQIRASKTPLGPHSHRALPASARRLWFDLIRRASALPCLAYHTYCQESDVQMQWRSFLKRAQRLQNQMTGPLARR